MTFSEVCIAIAPVGTQCALGLLLVLSVASVATTLERAWFFWQRRVNFELLTRQLVEWIRGGNLLRARGLLQSRPVGEYAVLLAGIANQDRGSQVAHQAMFAARSQEKSRMEQHRSILALVSHCAIWIAGVGTLFQAILVIQCFRPDAMASSEPWQVIAGQAIAALLIGFVISVPASCANRFFERRTQLTLAQIDAIIHLFQAHLIAVEAAQRKAEVGQAA
jgi:biopolymer transport protein ExbB/TolQ